LAQHLPQDRLPLNSRHKVWEENAPAVR